MTQLFRTGSFELHAGGASNFLIDADNLSDGDLGALAALVAPQLTPYSEVIGIPRGGLRFAKALEEYMGSEGGRLVVDDVLTTGMSMLEVMHAGDKGVVIFNRGRRMPGVFSIFSMALDLQ